MQQQADDLIPLHPRPPVVSIGEKVYVENAGVWYEGRVENVSDEHIIVWSPEFPHARNVRVLRGRYLQHWALRRDMSGGVRKRLRAGTKSARS